MIHKAIATLLVAVGLVCFTGATAQAQPVECHWDGVPVIVAIGGASVILVCGDGNILTHTTNVTVDPSLEIDPHLLTPAP